MWVKRGWGKGHLFHGNRPFFRGEGNKDNIGEQPSRHTLLTFFSPQFILQFYRGARGWLVLLFSWAGLNKRLTSNCAHTFACNWQQPFLNEAAEGRRMIVEIISWSISTKVWDRAGIELATPGIAVRHASVARVSNGYFKENFKLSKVSARGGSTFFRC